MPDTPLFVAHERAHSLLRPLLAGRQTNLGSHGATLLLRRRVTSEDNDDELGAGPREGSYRMLNFTVPHLLHWPREGSICAAGGVGLARSHWRMVATQKESARALYELELELKLELELTPFRGHCHPLLQGGVYRDGRSTTTVSDGFRSPQPYQGALESTGL